MRLQPRNLVLLLPAAACFVEMTRTPLTGDPGHILTGMMGFFLGWWAMAAVKQAHRNEEITVGKKWAPKP